MIVQFNNVDEYLKAVKLYITELDAVAFYLNHPAAVEAHVFWRDVDYAFSYQGSDEAMLIAVEGKLSREQFAQALGFSGSHDPRS